MVPSGNVYHKGYSFLFSRTWGLRNGKNWGTRLWGSVPYFIDISHSGHCSVTTQTGVSFQRKTHTEKRSGAKSTSPPGQLDQPFRHSSGSFQHLAQVTKITTKEVSRRLPLSAMRLSWGVIFTAFKTYPWLTVQSLPSLIRLHHDKNTSPLTVLMNFWLTVHRLLSQPLIWRLNGQHDFSSNGEPNLSKIPLLLSQGNREGSGMGPTWACAVQCCLRSLEFHSSVVWAAVHGAVVGPPFIDGSDVQVRRHSWTELLPELTVLAGIGTPQA